MESTNLKIPNGERSAREAGSMHIEDSFNEDPAPVQDEDMSTDESKYRRRLDCVLLPTVSVLYFFEYLDRGNIANAKLLDIASGHNTADSGVGRGATSLGAAQWQIIIMIFYVGLVLFQIPGTIGYRIFSPSKWIAFSVCSWAAVTMLQASAFDYGGLITCRIMLGIFEGLFGTGIIYYLSLWYQRTELGVRVFWFLGPTAIAGAFGGLIAYGIGHIKSPVPQWKWLFIVEGVPCFILGLFCLYWLPDRPEKNSTFRGRYQEIAVERSCRETNDKAGPMRMKHFIMVFTDWKLYIQGVIYITTASLLASISGFLPSIIQAEANLMTIPPYACAFVVMFFASWLSDRFRQRGIIIAFLSITAAICYFVTAALPAAGVQAKYGLICIAVACVYATYPPSHAWTANNFGNETKRAVGMGAYTAMGNLGSIAGSWFYPQTEAPLFREGFYICGAMALTAAVVSLLNSFLLWQENKRRDRVYGKPSLREAVDVSEEADAAPMFRFIT